MTKAPRSTLLTSSNPSASYYYYFLRCAERPAQRSPSWLVILSILSRSFIAGRSGSIRHGPNPNLDGVPARKQRASILGLRARQVPILTMLAVVSSPLWDCPTLPAARSQSYRLQHEYSDLHRRWAGMRTDGPSTANGDCRVSHLHLKIFLLLTDPDRTVLHLDLGVVPYFSPSALARIETLQGLTVGDSILASLVRTPWLSEMPMNCRRG